MKLHFGLALVVSLSIGLPLSAQESEQDAGRTAIASDGPSPMEGRVPNTSGIEVLSKATPQELANYPFHVLAGVRNHWFPQLRDLRKSASWKSGTAIVEFEIRRDGSLGEVNNVQSAGNSALDAAASQAITSAAPFPPLPQTYPRDQLRVRYHFGYDQPASPEAPLCNGPNWGAHSNALLLQKVGNGVAAPRATSAPDPEYSDTARRTRYQSRVRLAGTVDTQGAFTDLCVLIPAGAGLDEQAMSAVRQWRFEPATVDGQLAPVRIHVEVDFRLY